MNSMLRKARSVVQRELKTATFWGSLIVGLLATLVSFAIVDGLFFFAVREVLSIHNSPHTPNFNLPSHNWVFVLICFSVGVTAIGTKKWVLPLVAGLLGYAFIIPEYGGSGPITAFMPLIILHIELLGVAVVLNLLLAIIWIRKSKRTRCVGSLIHRIATFTER